MTKKKHNSWRLPGKEINKSLIRNALGQDNMVVIFSEEKGVAHLPTKIICICEWNDKSLTSFVTDNTLYHIYDALDQIHNPVEVMKIWAAEYIWNEDQGAEGYVDTSSDPTLVNIALQKRGPTWEYSDPTIKPFLINFWPPISAIINE